MSTPPTCWNTQFCTQEKAGLFMCPVPSIHGSPPKLSIPPVWVFRGDLGAFTFPSQMASVWVEVNKQIFLSLRTQDRTEKNNNAAQCPTSKREKPQNKV